MLNINNQLHKYNIIPQKYIIKNKVVIVETKDNKYVFKKRINNNIYDYLNTRNFTYYPKVLSDKQDEYEITLFIDNPDIPNEQKILDLIEVVSILHHKTTHYKEITEDDIKKTYEEISNNIDYLYSYYNDLMTIIESKVFPSPPEYLLSRNISKIYNALSFCKHQIDEWLEKNKQQKRKRLVVLHNNLSLNHFIDSNEPYLISWDKSKIDSPIYDLYKLYKNYSLDYDFNEILKKYEKKYPLEPIEKELLFILISLPNKIEFDTNNYQMSIRISNFIDELYKTEELVSPYYLKDTK